MGRTPGAKNRTPRERETAAKYELKLAAKERKLQAEREKNAKLKKKLSGK